MRKTIWLFVFILISFLSANSQKGSIKGTAFDTISKQPVGNATITLLKKKDSTLISFSMTDNSGRFEMTGIPNGEYRLLITHINYHNSSKLFVINDSLKNIDAGNIVMNDKNQVLNEVVVVAEAPPVTIIGDTIQYNAGSFKTQPNANVEELLKKLPGVKVEKDGTVKAQGETVKKVLVDGKEFFGNDPKIATKNLPADAIDKVQVYDKLSDQAQMTGFDDGNSEKTINLKLKKDKKKGMFGKINGGAGTDARFQGKANMNSFKGARQMSAIGMGNNTNAEGFSFMDILNFTGALNQLKNGGGNISVNISDDDPIAGLLGGNNSGINTTFGGGLNYNNILGNKTDFQSNYFYSRYNPKKETHKATQYFSPANTVFQNSYSDNLNNTHRANFNADYQIDSFHSIKISPSFSYQTTKNKSNSDFLTLSDQGFKTNEGSTNSLSNSEGYNFSTNLLFRKRFHRKGRTFSLNLLGNLNNSDGDGTLRSITDFYNQSGAFLRSDSVDQINNTEANLRGYNARAVYTEPIFKRSLLEFSVGKSYAENKSLKTTYDYNKSSNQFDKLNSRLTNEYENNYGYTNGGFRIRKQTKKYNYAAGVSWQKAELEGKIISGTKDSTINKNFTNLLPSARFQYSFSKFKNLTFNYSTNTNQPSASQLQPVPDISNPLYVKEGNPDLKQEFMHLLRLNFSLVNPYKNTNFFTFITYQQTQNKIVNYDRINNFGIDSVRPVNVNGASTLSGNISWGHPVRFLKGSIELSSGIGFNKGKQLTNDLLGHVLVNNIRTITMGPEARLDMSATEDLSVSISAEFNYSKTKYTISRIGDAKYFRQSYSTDIGWQLPKKFFFATDFTYNINNQYSSDFNTRTPLWNASISKQVLHFSRGELKLSVNDLLNQNIGITRNTNQNYIEDVRTTSLKRFFLLSFTYSLSKTGLNNGGGNGVRVMMK